MFGGLFKGRKVTKAKKVSYEESKEYAVSDSHAERKALAKRTDVKPELLYYLAEDKSPTVRRKVATNPSTPRQADLILAEDSVDEVRCDLALKIGRLVPNISESESERLQAVTFQVLEILAADVLPRVRQIVAEEIKRAENVPQEIIDLLARHVELIVAAPILEYSPLLTDDDLLEIIAASPVRGGLNAIAKRRSVNLDISDAIAAAQDIPAVASLLANQNAQIREETLDQIVDSAAHSESLHEPLVKRPELSQLAMRHISSFVSLSLLDILTESHKLDKPTEKVVRAQVKKGIKGKDVTKSESKAQAAAQKMVKNNELNDGSANKLIQSRDYDVLLRAMAIKSGLSIAVAKKIVESKSGKTVTALVWKSGLSMRTALAIQRELAKVPPGEIVNARDGIEYSLSEDEMSWYLDFFAD